MRSGREEFWRGRFGRNACFSALVIAALSVSHPIQAADAEAQAAIAAAADGAALESLLAQYPNERVLISKRADALGLALVELNLGTPGSARSEMRVTGGGKPFRDCSEAEGCPQMVVVPPSPPGFQVGSPETEKDHGDDEGLTQVSLPAFAIGATAVTVAEYRACVNAKACKPPEWLEPGGQHNVETGSSRYYRNLGNNLTDPGQPIVGVSYEDAVAYAAWLSQKTGHTYRLPSEVQWEFAARAGTRRHTGGATRCRTMAAFARCAWDVAANGMGKHPLPRMRSRPIRGVFSMCTGMSGSGPRTSIATITRPVRKTARHA